MEPSSPLGLGVRFFVPLLLLAVGWGVGSAIERAHLRRLRLGEIRWRRLPALSIDHAPAAWGIGTSGLVSASVVVSIDHWKRLMAWLRSLVGGRLRAYETLLERARREALIRLKEHAHASGYDAVIGVRLETSRLASARADGEGTTGVEVLAFGTGVKRLQ